MTQEDHLALLRGGVDGKPGAWADLGSGTGAFTIALATLMGGEGRILSVDTDARALREQERAIRAQFPRLHIELAARDFTGLSDVPRLDGVVMANSLHFQRDAEAVLKKVLGWLRPGGSLVVVEYDVEIPNPWVPHPLPFSRFVGVATAAGFTGPHLLETRPSRYHRRVYSAAAARPDPA
ncbi:MAG: class I SAM-dependent methyltransferase [Spirochaetia bacterium]|jgi:SAM-dependent methyltransferase